MDVELSRWEGWRFAAKLVRGAYTYLERARAQELGYEDPINPDYETTNRMYHKYKLVASFIIIYPLTAVGGLTSLSKPDFVILKRKAPHYKKWPQMHLV